MLLYWIEDETLNLICKSFNFDHVPEDPSTDGDGSTDTGGGDDSESEPDLLDGDCESEGENAPVLLLNLQQKIGQR